MHEAKMALSKVLVDSSFLIALYDVDSAQRLDALEIADLYKGRFLIPQVSLTETLYLIRREMGISGAVLFLETFGHSNPNLQSIIVDDLLRAKDIMHQYAYAKFDFVDCCIRALSERLNVTQVCTFDVRDFSIFRPKHCDSLELLP
jgi:predicted nucleic acid-binding protein